MNDTKAPLVKGASLLGFYKYVKDQALGERLLDEVLAALPPDSAAACGKMVVAVADYPYQVFVDYIRAVDEVMGAGDLGACHQLGEYAGGRDVQAFADMVKAKPTPAELLRAAGILWKNYHINSGRLKTEDASPDNTVIRIHDFPLMDPAHCRLMEGYFCGGLKELGLTWIEEAHETTCMSDGGPYHEFMGRWRQ